MFLHQSQIKLNFQVLLGTIVTRPSHQQKYPLIPTPYKYLGQILHPQLGTVMAMKYWTVSLEHCSGEIQRICISHLRANG